MDNIEVLIERYIDDRDDLTDAAAVEDELLRNRFLSLLFEGGHRWIDMRRFGRLDELPTDAAEHRVHAFFPIPTAEIDARGLADAPTCQP